MRRTPPLHDDARAVSTTLGYTLNVAVATLLIVGLLFAGGNVVQGERERTARAELRVVGQGLAADLAAADRLVGGVAHAETLRFERNLPASAAGAGYEVEVVAGPDPHLLLSTTDPDVTVRVGLALEAPVAPGTVRGGDVVVAWVDADGDGDRELEVAND